MSSKTTRDKFTYWTSSTNYGLAILCWSNTLENAHKFPELFHKYGNMQVLIPYILVTIFLIIPMIFAELVIGQYTNNGFMNMWRMVPIFRGLVWATAAVGYISSNHSLFMTTHAGYYLFKSFEISLPWAQCDAAWATGACYSAKDLYIPTMNASSLGQSSVELFHKKLVLAEDQSSFTGTNLRLFVFMLASLGLVAMCIINHTRSIERLLNLLFILPLLLLVMLTIASLLYRTRTVGLDALVAADLIKLLDYQLWVDVVNNAVSTIGLGMGGLICIASHGDFRTNVYNIVVVTPVFNLFIDMTFTLFVYCNLLEQASVTNITLEELYNHDASLLFVKIPAILLQWPYCQQFWTMIYFLYLFVIAARHFLFVFFTITEAFHEIFHCVLTLRKFSIGVMSFLIVFVMPLYISPMGSKLYTRMEQFTTSTFVTFVVMLEAVGIYYIYNAKRLLIDVHFMLNKRLQRLEYLMYLIPIVLLLVTVTNVYNWIYEETDYQTLWIFIIQCVIFGGITVFFLAHIVVYAAINWRKKFGWIISPSEHWGCSNEDMRRNREFFRSKSADARFTYRQQLYERTIQAMN